MQRKFFLAALMVPSLAMAGTPGLRREKTVLPGALTRAGGPGGMRSLPDETIEELCEEGFRDVYYLYPTVNFPNAGRHECERGVLDYKAGGLSRKAVHAILSDVAAAARGEHGPVLVHCWNGSHAAGEVASYALIQLCGWSGDRAAEYWERTIHDPENLDLYGRVVDRIRAFEPFPDLRISPTARARACP